MSDREEHGAASHSGRIHILQPNRDLESNWAVDLAKNLEDYLLKICSGEITSVDNDSNFSVNFAEAALLIQGSIQVYSRKVEYLYSLVLHALEFISQKRQEHQDTAAAEPNRIDACAVDEENESFVGLDDVPVELKNRLDEKFCKDVALNNFVRPPANLLVLEGDCLDAVGDAGELEGYLLAITDQYRDFLLLDPCDADAVDKFLEGNNAGLKHNVNQQVSSLSPKSHQGFLQSPTGRSGGTLEKSKHGKSVDGNQAPTLNSGFRCNDEIHAPAIVHDNPENNAFPKEVELDDGFINHCDDSDCDDDDPWEPLNPHEPGNLKVKPFRKVTIRGKKWIRPIDISSALQFPIAKLDRLISPELDVVFTQLHAREKQGSEPLPPYEKLRKSLIYGESEAFNDFDEPSDGLNDECEPDFPDADQGGLKHDGFMDTDKSDANINFDGHEDFVMDGPSSQSCLEDLCRSHLDALLANIAKTEKQEELAARISTWKQRIEHTLEEQDLHPTFDIHDYGERVLDKLSSNADSGGCLSFADIVSGQTKHEVARTFSALLQLVNNGNVDLEREDVRGKSICHTVQNPFAVRLLRKGKILQEMQLHSSKKRMKSPLRTRLMRGQENRPPPIKSPSDCSSNGKSLPSSGKFSVKVGKSNLVRCTPEGKRRRRSRFLIETVDLQSSG